MISNLCALLVRATACCGIALAHAHAHAQPAPQSDSEFRITAWAPKPLELPPYAGVHRPHWKLAELLVQHSFLVQVPYRTPYQLETVGDDASLRLEVMVAGASTLYPRGETPVPVAGKEFIEVTLPGRGRYDENNRPYLDFLGDVVRDGRRPGMFVRDDRLMAVPIRGQGIPRPPDTDRGHMHIDYGELWFILEGKADYLLEGVPFFTAGEGDVVYVPAGRFHRPTFGGNGMSTRIGINGFHSGVHVELVPAH